MSGILNRTRLKKMLTKFLRVVRLRWHIYPDILNGNTIKWSVDMKYRSNIVGLNGMRYLRSS